MNRIALVEDHARLATLVERGLAAAGIAVDVFPDAESAWRPLIEHPYAAVIVDRGLPGGDGLELVRRLRTNGHRVPCLMLTARDALRDRVDGLEAGADDYLTKPFALEELLARVRALMRRPPTLRDSLLEYAGLQVAPEAGSMRCGDDTVSLAPAELQIMICLVRANGRTVRRQVLEQAAWGLGEAVTPNALDVALHRLRKKLAAICANPTLVNLRGQGYALQDSPT
ncbi:response regulator transcription factor [Luteimonas abyssi]|uniref:response regulator transcription factor n=1 Tax=Luteimonas abyssi TaxID=1247514 RepID=UPI000737B203|nr:response regulator transcription factor [Luteimonas abyssi]